MTADFIMYEEEDWPETFKYQNSAGVGQSLTGLTNIFFVASVDGTTAKFTKTYDPVEGIIIDPDQTTNPGEFTVTISGEDTDGLGGKTLSYEIKYVDGAGVARVIYPAPNTTGTFQVMSSLTAELPP